MKNHSNVKNWLTINPDTFEVRVYETYKEAWEKSETFFETFGRVLLVEPMMEVA
jgi:hypothetical protein